MVRTPGVVSWLVRSATLRQYVAATAASMSVLMSGMAFTWITQILGSLLGPESEVPMTRDQSSWIISVIEIGNFLTPLPAGLVVDSWGRKPCLLIVAPLYILSWVLVLSTRSVIVLYVVRFIQGVGMGVVFTVLPAYLGEISETRLRGTISTLFEVMWYLGTLLQYCLAPVLSYQTLALLSLSVPIIYLLLFLLMPETPYFLLLVGKEKEATQTLLWLRGGETSKNVEEEMKEIKLSVDEDLSHRTSSCWTDLVVTPASRRCLLIVQVVVLIEVMSGIPALLSYVTDTFSQTHGELWLQPDQYTIIIGVLILVSTMVSAATVDSIGRRPILLVSSSGASFCQLVSGLYFYLDLETEVDVAGYSWVAVLSISCYSILLCAGCGAVSTVIQSEFFPSHTRGLGNGVTTTVMNLVSFLWLKLYEDVQTDVGIYLNFWIYATCGLLSALFVLFYVPETKGKTFAEIHREMALLNSSTPQHELSEKIKQRQV